MKVVYAVIVVISLVSVSNSQSRSRLPRFEQYKTKVHSGKIRHPKWMSFENGNARDEQGKLTDRAHINFAGKYFISAHSCGTECRYYTMTDLSNGRDSGLPSIFDASEATPRKDIPILFTRRFSNLLIVQYLPKLEGGSKCRERSYLLSNGKFKPLTRLVNDCRQLN